MHMHTQTFLYLCQQQTCVQTHTCSTYCKYFIKFLFFASAVLYNFCKVSGESYMRSSKNMLRMHVHGILVSMLCIVLCGKASAVEQMFAITVVNANGNVFAIDGADKPILNILRSGVYTFDQSHSSNAGHQIAFKDSTGTSYTTGVTTTGTPGTSGAQTVFTVDVDAPDNLLYYCVAHGNSMGNTILVASSTPPETTPPETPLETTPEETTPPPSTETAPETTPEVTTAQETTPSTETTPEVTTAQDTTPSTETTPEVTTPSTETTPQETTPPTETTSPETTPPETTTTPTETTPPPPPPEVTTTHEETTPSAETTPRETTTQEPTPPPSTETTPQETTTQETTPSTETTPQETTTQETTPQETTTQETTPSTETTPSETTPPTETTSPETTPSETTPPETPPETSSALETTHPPETSSALETTHPPETSSALETTQAPFTTPVPANFEPLICVGCPAGFFLSRETLNCTQCPPGSGTHKYSNASSAEQCMCLPGFSNTSNTFNTSNNTPNTSETCVLCPAGSYKETLGNVSCTSCPANSTTPFSGETNATQCVCNAGFKENRTSSFVSSSLMSSSVQPSTTNNRNWINLLSCNKTSVSKFANIQQYNAAGGYWQTAPTKDADVLSLEDVDISISASFKNFMRLQVVGWGSVCFFVLCIDTGSIGSRAQPGG